MKDLLSDAQTDLGLINGDVDMFVMDLPVVINGGAVPTVMVAQAAHVNSDTYSRVVGICHLVQSVGSAVPAAENGENSLSPSQAVKNYFLSREDIKVTGVGTVRVLKAPAHGVMKDQGDGEYSYIPNVGYVGKDLAVMHVEIGDYKVEVIYYFQALNHALGNTGYKDLCGRNGTYWKISSANPFDGKVGTTNLNAWQRASDLSALLANASQSLADFTDLSGTAVGETTGQGPTAQITLDTTAAGHNWYIDPTPLDNTDDYLPSAPPRDSDVKRYVDLKFTTKKERNQNMADAFYQGGHSQTALALAFAVSSSTVSRVILSYENGA